MFSAIWNWLKNAAKSFWNGVKRLWRAVVDFVANVYTYFKNLRLIRGKHKPFIGQLDMLDKLKDGINNAPERPVGGIFEGVYNQETNEIEHFQIIESNHLDAKTKEILGNDPLVVLS